MTETARSTDGTTIAFDTVGDGPPLILVPGALNTRGDIPPYVEALSPTFRVVTYDRRGRGDSGDTPPYAVEREVEDLQAVIDAIGGRAALVGFSSGAALSLETARRSPDLERVVAYEPPFIVDDTRAPVPDDYVAHLDELVANGERGDAVAYFMVTGVGMPADMVGGMRSMPMWPGLEALAHTIAYDGRVMGAHVSGRRFSPGEWDDVTVPVLVCDGGDSPPWMRNGARALADALPNATYRTLEGQTHQVAPEALAPAVTEFLDG
jgi:pimeloyl-ACP methyl ester carboxylesterase